MMKKISIMFFMCILSIVTINAQNTPTQRVRKANEIGIGWSGLQFSRITQTNFIANDNSYSADTRIRNIVHCGNLYFAHELNQYFYVDFQGSVGFVNDFNKSKQWLYQGGIGLQFRLSPIFNSKYIDPYIRIGAGYMYKEFLIDYSNINYLNNGENKVIHTNQTNVDNKDGLDKHHLYPISAGFGVNMWMNDHWGIGLQGDYLFMPYKNVANSLQGSVRVMFRFGGTTKKTYKEVSAHYTPPVGTDIPTPDIPPVTPPHPQDTLRIHTTEKVFVSTLISNISFDFDSDKLTEKSEYLLDDIANIMQDNDNTYYLIIGATDTKGSVIYNQNLSERRAKIVKEGLIERGVPKALLKSRGIGKVAAYANSNTSDNVREGDRKVTIEIIDNIEYWNELK